MDSKEVPLVGASLKAITAVLKKRFPNLTTEESIDIAVAILEVLS